MILYCALYLLFIIWLVTIRCDYLLRCPGYCAMCMHAAAPSYNGNIQLEVLGASRLLDRKSDEFPDISDLIFNSILNNITECIYYVEPNLELPGRKLQSNNQVTLTLLHVNPRSLNNFANFDALDEFLSSLANIPDIVCISETRLKGEPLINISMPNYNFIHADSETNAGGVAIYVASKYKFEIDYELKLNSEGIEDLRLNLILDDKNSKKLTIGAIYRHPNSSKNNIENFTESLCNSINKITNRKGTFFILEDMNIDISINKRTPCATLYIEHLITVAVDPSL